MKGHEGIPLPQEMLQCLEGFMTYYNPASRQRKLTWIHTYGQCQVRCLNYTLLIYEALYI
jgi:hypothetical protein